jgi:hypothetical protein
MQILNCLTVMVCSHYITFLSVVARASQWPSGPVWMDPLHSTPFWSCAILWPIPATHQIDWTVMHKCLPVRLTSQRRRCATRTSMAELWILFSCICLILQNKHTHAHTLSLSLTHTHVKWAVCNSMYCRNLHVHLLQIQTYCFIANENTYTTLHTAT